MRQHVADRALLERSGMGGWLRHGVDPWQWKAFKDERRAAAVCSARRPHRQPQQATGRSLTGGHFPERGIAMTDIRDARILILATNGFEQLELTVPRDELREAGAKVDVATPDGKPIRGWNKTDWGDTAEADLKIADARPDNYQALVLPGGQINPDLLRVDADAMKVIRAFLDSGKPVAAICHAPWLLIQADAVRGLSLTSYRSIRKDVENAGGKWVDKEVVVDQGIITSRSPDDLKAFVPKIIEEVKEGRHQERKKAA
jgi:protease I